ncbi:MAG: hypothetical protein ACW972_10840 [Promethearchaeota archaeon]|jgi:hypothetical protein
MENRKLIGLILLIIGALAIIINLAVIYPFINCTWAPWAFWLIALIGILGGLLIYFEVKIFYSED